jgi:ketosteroid isomerase-like protein
MTDEIISALEDELRAAQLSSDVAVLGRLIHDDLLFTGPSGALATKAEDLAMHASGQVRFTLHAPEDLRIRHVGADVSIVALRTRLAGTFMEQPFSGVFRYTRVWARENGQWQIVGGHVSAVSGDGT